MSNRINPRDTRNQPAEDGDRSNIREIPFQDKHHVPWDNTDAPARNIFIFHDGTWNYPGQEDKGITSPSNIFKLSQMVDESDEKNISFYYRGVGNPEDNNWLSRAVGGATGAGMQTQMLRSYYDLIGSFKPNDNIYIFGFSRGATVARMLANRIEEFGIPDSIHYTEARGRGYKRFIAEGRNEVKVKFLGVFDTVEAQGIAKDVLGLPFGDMNLFTGINERCPACVEKAVHCVSIDENRDAFKPTLLNAEDSRVDEMWFAGGHSNIGGGYSDRGLSDVTLRYMLDAMDGELNPALCPFSITPTFAGELRVESSFLYDAVVRQIPQQANVHETVYQRVADPGLGYDPKNLPQQSDGVTA